MLYRLITRENIEPDVLFILHVIIRIPFPSIDDISSIKMNGIDFIKIRSIISAYNSPKYRISRIIIRFIYFTCVPSSFIEIFWSKRMESTLLRFDRYYIGL